MVDLYLRVFVNEIVAEIVGVINKVVNLVAVQHASPAAEAGAAPGQLGEGGAMAQNAL